MVEDSNNSLVISNFVSAEGGKSLGQMPKILDIEGAKKALEEMAAASVDIVVTQSTLKECVKLWQERRNTRLMIQKASKQNQDYVKGILKSDKEGFENLVSLIVGEEDRLKEGIKIIEDDIAKKKQEKKDAELKKKLDIELKINKYESTIDSLYKTAFTLEAKKEYVLFLEKLQDEIDDDVFEDLKFEARRIKVIGDSMLKVIDKQIEQREEEELQKERAAKIIADKKIEDQKRKEEEEAESKRIESQKEEVLNIRLMHLEDKGFIVDGSVVSIGEVSRDLSVIKGLSEVDWYDLQSKLEVEVKVQEQTLKNQQEENKQESIRCWKECELLERNLGGKGSRSYEGEAPTLKEIDAYVLSNKELKKQVKTEELKAVKKELESFRLDALEFANSFSEKVRSSNFDYSASKKILEDVMSKYNDICNALKLE